MEAQQHMLEFVEHFGMANGYSRTARIDEQLFLKRN